MKFLVKFDLEFDLKFAISDVKNQVKFRGRTFLPSRKGRQFRGEFRGRISDQISEKISETSFQISRVFLEASFSRRAALNECFQPFWSVEDELHDIQPTIRLQKFRAVSARGPLRGFARDSLVQSET